MPNDIYQSIGKHISDSVGSKEYKQIPDLQINNIDTSNGAEKLI